MDDLIVPNWHPFLVHFTVAMTVAALVFALLAKITKNKSEEFRIVAKWSIVAAASVTLLTVAAGFAAFNSVAHDDIAHSVMKTHRNWALVSFTVLIIVAFLSYRSRTISKTLVASSVLVTFLVGTTAYYGAELVYRHGLGVMRIPDSAGEDHSHQNRANHRHAQSLNKQKEKDGEHDHRTHNTGGPNTDFDPGQVADAFLEALKTGNTQAVSTLLANDVLIIEGGHAQTTKADYMNGHMKSDMKFVPNMNYDVLSRETGQSGDRAWVLTFSRSTGIYNGKEYDRTGREFMLLHRYGGAWKIQFIDWADK